MRKRLQSTLLVIVLALVMIMTAGLAACAQDDAPPEPEKYTVTVENGTGGGKFDEGTEITVTATVPEGKEFESWQSGGTVVSTANPYTFTVRKDITLTATFKDAAVTPPDPGPEGPDPDKELEDLEDEVWYTVVADGGRIDGADVSSKQVKSGTEVQITAVIPEFYDFECWNKDGEKFTEEQTFTYEVTANVKFTSVISAVSRYKLTAEGCTYESIYQAGTEVVTVKADERENYEFVNWTINGETVNEPEIYTFELTEDTTVVANFRRVNIEVKALSSDEIIKVNVTSDDADPETGLFEEGDKVTVKAELYNGIELNGWRDEEGELLSRDNPYTFTVTDDITVTADIGDHYTVTVVGGTLVGNDELTTAEYGMNANCSVQATVGENEIFINWTDEEGVVLSTANPYVFKVNDDITVTAHVEEVAPGITYVFEAENADLTKLINQDGGNRCVENHANDDHGDPILNATNYVSNGWVAACFNHNWGNTITWNIRSDSAAEAIMVMRMGSGAWVANNVSDDITLSPENVDFLVNGQQLEYGPIFIEGRTGLPGSTSVSAFGFMSDYTISMRIQLKEGMNEISMILRASGSGPNIDALKLITEAQLTWTPEVNGGAPIAAHDYNVDDVWGEDLPETTYIFEAENADLSKCIPNSNEPGWTEWHGGDDHGDPVLNATHRVSNEWIAAGFNDTLNNTITWRINSDREATATLLMRMCSGSWESGEVSLNCEINPDNLEFSVNGTPLEYGPILLSGITAAEGASTNSVYGYMSDYVIAYNVQLKAGVNEISMKLISADAGPNIDALKIRTSAKLTWTPTKNGDAPIADYGYNVSADGTKTYIFEAENADLTKLVNQAGGTQCVETRENDDLGSPELNEEHGVSNGWIAACFNHVPGNTITWRIYSDSRATATLIFRMCSGVWVASDESGDVVFTSENITLTINSAPVEYESVTLPGLSGSTSVFGYMNDYTLAYGVQLNEGVNVITLTYNSGGAPNIDALKLVTDAALTWIPAQNNGAPIADYGYNVASFPEPDPEPEPPAELEGKEYIFEAENADVSKVLNKAGESGDAVESWIGIDHGDETLNETSVCSNGWAAKNLNEQVGNQITWVIYNNSETEMTASLVMRCANGNWVAEDSTGDINETPERLQFTINGEVIDYAPFTVKGHTRLPEASPNSQYGLFADYLLTTELVLKPGENVITMTVLVMGAGTNVDALKIYTDAELTWVPTQNNDAPIADYGFNVASFPEQA